MLNRQVITLIGVVVLINLLQVKGNGPQHPNDASSSSANSNSSSHRWFDVAGVFRNVFKLPVSVIEAEAIKERGGLVWKRPTNIAQFPHTWHTFKAKNASGEEVEFVIKDIPRSRFNQVVDLMALYTLKTDPIYNALDIWTNADAVNIFKNEWTLILKQKMSVACFTNDGSDTIVGISILNVLRKDDVMFKLIPDYPNYRINRLEQLYRRIKFDTFEHYKVDEFLGSAGIGIHPTYEHFGIDLELLRSREGICRTFGLAVTSTLFTSPASNTAANQLQFNIDKTLSYNDIRKVIPEFTSITNPRITLRSKEFK
ncbi:uncharacterized protein LOC116345296 [Contarinia nasturtii]|uniref:uncharacterized protein LOC116345296 n=1 Tax=Contarinia nasturtii TaxID=265458 RepID=UPI0012D46426|nr:uncharacterized protein LOC116345296 [Contarinia nasturtii]